MRDLLLRAFSDMEIGSVVRMGGGKAGEIFLVNGEVVFKVASGDLDVEYRVLCALQGKLDMAIPRPVCLAALADGRTALGMSFVPGVQFTQEIYEEFSGAERDALFMQMGELLCQLHTASVPQIEGLSVWSSGENLADFRSFYTDAVKNALTLSEQAQIEKIAADFDAAVAASPVPMVLCHGDLHFYNLNYDPATKKICGLLDFGIACYNDPLNDMRYFWSDTVAKMLRSYRGNIGKYAAERHLFYNMCNLIEEAHSELANGKAGHYVETLKRAIFQVPLREIKEEHE